MKKLFYAIMIVCMMLGAEVCHGEEILGSAVYTDFTTYINHVPVESYDFNGNTLIVAEDLRAFGFDVWWNEYKETLTITRNNSSEFGDFDYIISPSADDVWQKAFDVTTTNVKVFTEGYQYSSFGGIYGKTLINIEDLTCIDGVTISWNPEVKALKVWVQGMEMEPTMLRTIPNIWYYDLYDYYEDDYYYNWEWEDDSTMFFLSFYLETEDGTQLENESGRLRIVDVIDADGRSILKNTVWSEYGTQYWPYVYYLSDGIFSSSIFLDPEDLYTKSASEDGGLIKLEYHEYGHDYDPYEFTVKVDQLPYYIPKAV